MLEGLDHERSRDVVREVGDELGGFGLELVDRELERVSPDQTNVRVRAERGAQLRLERAIELDRVDEPCSLGEAAREDAETRADLEHDVRRAEIAESLDHAEDVLVDEEVLAQRLLGRDGHANPNAAAAFAWVWAATASTVASRASARTRTVCTTFAGSFRVPRIGCGARYGLSVSTRILSAGTAPAASRRATAFGYVTLPANET